MGCFLFSFQGQWDDSVGKANLVNVKNKNLWGGAWLRCPCLDAEMEVWNRILLQKTVWRGQAETLVSQQNLLGSPWKILATRKACWVDLGLEV